MRNIQSSEGCSEEGYEYGRLLQGNDRIPLVNLIGPCLYKIIHDN